MSPPDDERRPRAESGATVETSGTDSVARPTDLEWIDHPVLGLVPALPLPGHPTVALSGFLEHSGLFVRLDRATDDDYRLAAELSRQRLRRCKFGSQTWWWHTAVIAADRRRRRSHLSVLAGGFQ